MATCPCETPHPEEFNPMTDADVERLRELWDELDNSRFLQDDEVRWTD